MQAPELRPLCLITADLGQPIEKGSRSAGRLRIIPIIGGVVEGERLFGARAQSRRRLADRAQ